MLKRGRSGQSARWKSGPRAPTVWSFIRLTVTFSDVCVQEIAARFGNLLDYVRIASVSRLIGRLTCFAGQGPHDVSVAYVQAYIAELSYSTKIALYASLHSKISDHRTVLAEREKTLNEARECLLREGAAVVGRSSGGLDMK